MRIFFIQSFAILNQPSGTCSLKIFSWTQNFFLSDLKFFCRLLSQHVLDTFFDSILQKIAFFFKLDIFFYYRTSQVAFCQQYFLHHAVQLAIFNLKFFIILELAFLNFKFFLLTDFGHCFYWIQNFFGSTFCDVSSKSDFRFLEPRLMYFLFFTPTTKCILQM